MEGFAFVFAFLARRICDTIVGTVKGIGDKRLLGPIKPFLCKRVRFFITVEERICGRNTHH